MNILTIIRKALSHYTWDLAYGEYNEKIIYHGIDWHKIKIIKNPYKKKWFADPFILEVTDEKIVFLVEEFDSNINRGRIAKITVNKKTNTINECKIILDLPTHLSFPAIYHENGNIYVHPENSASGKSTMYKFDIENDKLIAPIVVAELPLVDAVIRKENDVYKMYATQIPDAGGNVLMELTSDKITGPYKQINQKVFERRQARMAGSFIDTSEGAIRPAQDCNRDYGEAVLFYKDMDVIFRQEPGIWKFEGLHTFNKTGNYFVVDLKKYSYPVVHQFLKTIKGLIKI